MQYSMETSSAPQTYLFPPQPEQIIFHSDPGRQPAGQGTSYSLPGYQEFSSFRHEQISSSVPPSQEMGPVDGYATNVIIYSVIQLW